MTITKELDGNKFIELGNKFITLHKVHNMDSDNLDFNCGKVAHRMGIHVDTNTKNHCGTIACHGGWGCVLFKQANIDKRYQVYGAGSRAIAEFLGFEDPDSLTSHSLTRDNIISRNIKSNNILTAYLEWAEDNYDMWGNRWGASMFLSEGYISFGKITDEPCTLEDIGLHYVEVGERILESNETITPKY